jgi:hypothetical protein
MDSITPPTPTLTRPQPYLAIPIRQYVYGNCFLQHVDDIIRERIAYTANDIGIANEDLFIVLLLGAPPPVPTLTPMVLNLYSTDDVSKEMRHELATRLHESLKHLRSVCSGDDDIVRS